MFTGFTDETIRFFLDLKFHNNTEYFHQEHDRYVEEVQQVFYAMIEDLAPDMLKIDPQMEVRPRDHLWYLFRHAAEPREKSLFYYFEAGPDRLGWGMGFWDENREALDLFRKRMRANPEGTLALLDDLDLPRRKMILGGTAHKKMPVPPEIPERLKRWYLAKDFYIFKENPDYKMIYSDKILKEVRRDFKALAPLYQLLRGYVDELG